MSIHSIGVGGQYPERELGPFAGGSVDNVFEGLDESHAAVRAIPEGGHILGGSDMLERIPAIFGWDQERSVRVTAFTVRHRRRPRALRIVCTGRHWQRRQLRLGVAGAMLPHSS